MEESTLLNYNTLVEMEQTLNSFTKNFDEVVDAMTYVINSFNNQEIVEKFYSTGTFGENQKQRLLEVSKALQEYKEVISNGEESLVKKTQNYISTLFGLVENGK